jgi:Glyoxalase-like domain
MQTTRLRQAVVVAVDRERFRRELNASFEVGKPFDDVSVHEFGLHNYVFPVGDTFIEVVSPTVANTTAGRFLSRNGGDCGYMVIFQVKDIAACRDHLRAEGIRAIWSHDAEEMASVHIHPQDIGGAIVSFEEPRPVEAWKWGGPGWETRSKGAGLAGVTMQADDPTALCQNWGRVLNISPNSASTRIALPDGCSITFERAPRSASRLSGIALRSGESAPGVTIAGTHFSTVVHLEPAGTSPQPK